MKQGIHIPWDLVAKEVEPHLTGEAMKQHLVKLRGAREENGRKVPEKLEKSARRKTSKLAGTGFTTPAKGGRGRKVKDEDDDEGDGDTTVKNANLLWTPAPKKAKAPTVPKTPKKEGGDVDAGAMPKTPATGRGRKKATGGAENRKDGDGALGAPKTKSTGKRGRKQKQEVKEEGDEVDFGSPSKKQKMVTLRPTHRVDYNEQPEADEDEYDARQPGDDDEAYDEEVEPLKAAVKMEHSKSSSASVENERCN